MDLSWRCRALASPRASPRESGASLTWAIENACQTLPWGAKNPLSPTVWQTRAREVATAVNRKLPPDSSYAEKLCAGSAAVRQITSVFEDDELRKRTLQAAYLWDIRPDEHEDAKEAMRRQLESLPVGTPARTMEKAREQVLAPLREAKKRKDRIDRAVPRIRGYSKSYIGRARRTLRATGKCRISRRDWKDASARCSMRNCRMTN
jgi:hypothetical protein